MLSGRPLRRSAALNRGELAPGAGCPPAQLGEDLPQRALGVTGPPALLPLPARRRDSHGAGVSRSERAMRPAVLWRKGSFRSDSEAGSRFAERLLTVAASCRQQGRPLLAFLVA